MRQLIDFVSLEEEVVSILSSEKSMVLATSCRDDVSARAMSHVNDGLTIYFQTAGKSGKARQIGKNPHVAIALANLQIKATAQFCGFTDSNPAFLRMYQDKFPNYFSKYSGLSDEIVIKAVPDVVSIYKYIGGKPCVEVLDLMQSRADRIY